MIIAALCFAIYGITILSVVLNHFHKSQIYCSSVVDNLDKYYDGNIYNITMNSTQQTVLSSNPALFLWNNCLYKVYPFNDICQCRTFRIDLKDKSFLWTDDELQIYFDISLNEIFSNILSKWYMLEKFEWNDDGSMDIVNFTSDMFNAKQMKAVSITAIDIRYISQEISNWNELEYLSVTGIGITTNIFPNATKTLKKLLVLTGPAAPGAKIVRFWL